MGYFQSNFEGQIMEISPNHQNLNQSGFSEAIESDFALNGTQTKTEWDPQSDDEDEKKFDPALFDVTKIPVNDFANQITRDDYDIFKKITTEEVGTTQASSFFFNPMAAHMAP